MKEIKFRAWHKDRMIPWREHLQSETGGVQYYFPQMVIDKDIILMQYTGLKDKNGKECFEGDIISEKEVYFDKKTASFDLKGSNLRLWASAGINEIQGNVYENPELIK